MRARLRLTLLSLLAACGCASRPSSIVYVRNPIEDAPAPPVSRDAQPSAAPGASTMQSRESDARTLFFSNGLTARRLGNTWFFSNGMTARRMGDFTFFSDGTTASHMGNFTFFNNGLTATRMGDFTFFSDGTTAMRMGDFTFINNGKHVGANARH